MKQKENREWKANAQIAHLVFCRHTGKLKKTKRAILFPTLKD